MLHDLIWQTAARAGTPYQMHLYGFIYADGLVRAGAARHALATFSHTAVLDLTRLWVIVHIWSRAFDCPSRPRHGSIATQRIG